MNDNTELMNTEVRIMKRKSFFFRGFNIVCLIVQFYDKSLLYKLHYITYQFELNHASYGLLYCY